MRDLEIRSERPRFTTDKHFLGKLCKRAHDFHGMGLTWRHYTTTGCVECSREAANQWRLDNPERAAANTSRRDQSRAANPNRLSRRELYPFVNHLQFIRKRSTGRGLNCDLAADDLRRLWLMQGGLCFWTGRAIDFHAGPARAPFRPSIDRLHPAMGYVVGNVVWCSNFANRGRGDYPAKDFAELMATMGFPSRVGHAWLASQTEGNE